jgi:hypothetical protein
MAENASSSITANSVRASSRRLLQKLKHALVHLVIRFFQAQPLIRFLRSGVVAFHIEAHSANVPGDFRFGHDMRVERFENAFPARGFVDVNTLQPPEIAVAPIAPFVSDQHLADDLSADFGNEIGSFRGITQQRFDAGADASGVELNALCLVCQARVEIGDDTKVAQFSFSYNGIDEVRILARTFKSIFDPTLNARRLRREKRVSVCG